ncbi:peptidase family M17 [Schizosaccharomyces octosporus yFS286]|uniref:Peptidase family M17 n=1 Tax=Schizosaccharomyces octosporus (strain yFS286) TaxID=483514 RepID=S9RKF6_SCHOY|nr:peptidase family M17 [Schizosaccharomyces octosporus yFS286]EPX74469.1 peptidase family M17 [Schizosaccharomyces octosporus yFS286]
MKGTGLSTRNFCWSTISSLLLPRVPLATAKADSIILGVRRDKNSSILEEFRKVTDLFFETKPEDNDVRLFWNVHGYTRLAIVQLSDQITEKSIRTAAAEASRLLKSNGAKSIAVDGMGFPKDAALASALATFDFSMRRDHLAVLQNGKTVPKNELFSSPAPEKISLQLFTPASASKEAILAAQSKFHEGLVEASAQNMARSLMECPANYLTSIEFCNFAKELFKDCPNVDVEIHDEKWIDEQRMNGLLSVNAGSDIPPRFLEIKYRGAANSADKSAAEEWLGLVGKGITFDAGGISIKPSMNMKEMRADMGGAAVMLSAIYAMSQLSMPINTVFVTPLTENLPSGSAVKPGDIIFMRNGLSIEVDNTDAEGRLVLADAVHYVTSNYSTKAVLEASTLTGAMLVALGNVYTGAFVQGEELWKNLEASAETADDLFWRMPFHDAYLKQLTGSSNADLCNVNRASGGGACVAAAFIKCFLAKKDVSFAHLDIAGVMDKKLNAWDCDGMSGRPVRTIIELARKY